MNIVEFCAKLNIGGAQSFAASISGFADESFHFTYVVFGDDVGEYEKEIIRRGNTIIHLPEPKKNYLSFFARIVRLMKAKEYHVVHAHTMFNCGLIMLAARIAGVPGRISHSHTTNDDNSKTFFRLMYQRTMQTLIRRFSTEYLACGIGAGETLYGKEFFQKYGTVIRNGIDTDKYRFRSETRERLRKALDVQDRFVILHIGHYVKVKNQAFLVELMKSIMKERPDAILLLFGEGPERGSLENLIARGGVQDSVRLMGNSDSISEILSAGDVFAFPSLYEGTPIALIEAQTNGLPCVISDSIPDDACLLDNVRRVSLEAPEREWISTILGARRENPDQAADQIAEEYGTVRTTMEALYDVFRKYDKGKGTA